MYISATKRKYLVVLNIRKCLYATFRRDEGKSFKMKPKNIKRCIENSINI
jgi:hypothetical protein